MRTMSNEKPVVVARGSLTLAVLLGFAAASGFEAIAIGEATKASHFVGPFLIAGLALYFGARGGVLLLLLVASAAFSKCLDTLWAPVLASGVLTLFIFWPEDNWIKTSIFELSGRLSIAAAGAALIVLGLLMFFLAKKDGEDPGPGAGGKS